MKKRYHYILPVLVATTLLFGGCSAATTQNTSTQSKTTTITSTSTDENSSIATDGTATTTSSTSTIEVNKEFTASDLDVGYDTGTAAKIELSDSGTTSTSDGVSMDGNVITISKEGTYIMSGSLSDGQIVVDADDSAKVQLVLNGITLNCSESAAIYVKNADKVFITLAEGTTNTLSDGSTHTQTDDNTVDGVIFSKSDLTFNGNGTLKVSANYKHGIVGKDELTFTSGTYDITAIKDDLNGNEGIKIKDGTFYLSSTDGNGMSFKNSDDTTKGYVYIAGGTIDVKKSVEGIEGTAIVIEGGTIDITSSDDGMNSANAAASDNGGGEMSNDTNCYISISGGDIKINASGDGIDSNGNLYVSGGTIYVSGPTENNNGSLDYNGTADITGGTIVAAGSEGMVQGFSDSSTQYSITYAFDSVQKAGSEVTLKDSSGNVIASYTPDKDFQTVVISTADLAKDATYTITSGNTSEEITLSSVITSNVTNSGNGGMGPGGKEPRT